jgi:hypothetical protein
MNNNNLVFNFRDHSPQGCRSLFRICGFMLLRLITVPFPREQRLIPFNNHWSNSARCLNHICHSAQPSPPLAQVCDLCHLMNCMVFDLVFS